MANWNRDEDGRRIGDWQHRDLRKRSEDETLVENSGEKPWYMENFWIVIFLLVFAPIGLFLCWKSTWAIPVKIIATVLVVAALAGYLYVRYLAPA